MTARNHIRHVVAGAADFLLIALGILALLAAPLTSFCYTTPGEACGLSGTVFLDLLGFALIAGGATWAFAKRWPSRSTNRLGMFLAIWAIVVFVGSVWAYGMLSDWHWGPYCNTTDDCSLSPDMGGAFGFFTLVGLVVATVAVRFHRWTDAA